jgi:probable selenium-dependent hydroxylase accessory protein YqeC
MPSLIESLGLKETGIITLVGAGGKTSLMFTLAQELVRFGKTVVTTTTTKIHRPVVSQSPEVCLGDTAQEFIRSAGNKLHRIRQLTVASATHSSGEKLVGLSPMVVDELGQSKTVDWIIVEGDGAARKPLKAPAHHEPVIPQASQWVIGLIGLVSVGRKLNEQWVHRPDRYGAVSGLALGERITAESITKMLMHGQGIFKGSPRHAQKAVFLNLAGKSELITHGREIGRSLLNTGSHEITMVLIGNAMGNPAVVEYMELSKKKE